MRRVCSIFTWKALRKVHQEEEGDEDTEEKVK